MIVSKGPPAQHRATRTGALVLLTILVAVGAGRIGQGAAYHAAGLASRDLLLNAAVFGALSAACGALICQARASRALLWAAAGGVAWVLAAALGTWLFDARTNATFAFPALQLGQSRGHVYFLEYAIAGALSALGTSAALLDRQDVPWRPRVLWWSAWALLAALIAVVAGRGEWVA